MNSPVKTLTNLSMTKIMTQAKTKSLKNFFQKFSLKFISHAVYVWESLPLSYPHSLYKQTGEGGGEYADVITKFTCIDRFPIKYQ